MALFVVAALLSLALAAIDAAGAAPALPTAMQLEYQAREVSMFMHFSMCTFAPQGGCEQDTACRKNPASLFDPTALNTTQWIQTAKALGAKEVCLTAHHTGGFALFQSNVTDYGVKESPYQGGKGDIVKEFTDSCRAFGISPCLYFINAWDCWEASRPGVSKESYLQKQLGMLTELMNRDKYGKIDRFWFDQYGFPLPGPNGAPGKTSPTQAPPGLFPDAWSKIVDHVHTGSPGTMMLPGPDGCINPGEGGGGVYPVINYVNKTLLCSYPPSIENGGADYRPSVDGQLYVPFESDLSIQNPGDAWFYHKGHVYDNSSNLWGKYLATAGRGSTFILNIPPNRSGIIPEEFVEAVTGVGDAVTASFGTNVGTTSGAVKGTCDGKTPLATITAQGAACTAIFFFCKANFVQLTTSGELAGEFDAILLAEELSTGQNVLSFEVELQDRSGQWAKATLAPTSCAGQTIGSRCIAILAGGGAPTGTAAARVTCTAAIHRGAAGASLKSVSLHKLKPPQ